MRKILLLLMILTGMNGFSQDPDVGGSTIKGTLGDGSGPFANGETVSFTITAGNAGPNMVFPAPSNAPFEINITVAHFDNPVVTVAPGFVNYFSTPVVTLVNATIPVYTIVISQNAAIPETEYTRFIITGTAKGKDGDLVQYQANGDPGGYPNVGTDDPSAQAEISGSVLPVKLTAFEVTREGGAVNLAWSTTEEANSERFDVQRSVDGKNWKEIGTVRSGGESVIRRNYTFFDGEPGNGVNYYRLKMVDLDATYAFSGIRRITVEKTASRIYPNPVADVLSIDTRNLSRVELYRMDGVAMYDSGSRVKSKIDVRNFSGGMYLIRLHNINGTSETQKVVIAR